MNFLPYSFPPKSSHPLHFVSQLSETLFPYIHILEQRALFFCEAWSHCVAQTDFESAHLSLPGPEIKHVYHHTQLAQGSSKAPGFSLVPVEDQSFLS